MTPNRRMPDFVIIGAMKCGTSTLHDQLHLQPGIFMSTPKEPYFFSNDEVWAKGLDWYSSLFADAAKDDLCGESSTHYTKLPTYPHTIDRMKEHIPDAKLIYVIRHPIDRLVSHYIHDWSERKIDCSIDEAIDRHPDLINYSRYAMQLEPFLETYGTERVMLVFFEHMIAEPQAELERICRFIGYDGRPRWHIEEPANNVSHQRMRESKWRDAIVWNPVVTWARRTFVPQRLRDRVKTLWQMRKRPKLSPERLAALSEVFDQDLDRLSVWLDIEFTVDGFAAAASSANPDWAGITPSPVRVTV